MKLLAKLLVLALALATLPKLVHADLDPCITCTRILNACIQRAIATQNTCVRACATDPDPATCEAACDMDHDDTIAACWDDWTVCTDGAC